MKRIMTVLGISAFVIIAVVSCTAFVFNTANSVGPDGNALPQATASQSVADEPIVSKATTCDNAREAILTGSKADITKAMKALVADKKADATAREAAQDYLSDTDADLRKMHTDLVQLACS